MGDLHPGELREEACELLQRLIRLDTVNPPGNERPAQELLAAHLEAAGLSCELLGATGERPNLIATLDSGREGPTLGLLGHTDTVLAQAADWTHGPWSGQIADGCIWGRGAIDMKSQVAAESVAAASLARSGWRPASGRLLVLAVVDEETGGRLGAQWLTREHPAKVRCDMLINEGGGAAFEYGGRRRYGVSCAEKGVFRFIVRVRGVAAHASTPEMGSNALLAIAPLLERFAKRQPSPLIGEQAQQLLRALGEDPSDPEAALESMRRRNAALLPLLKPVLGITFTPTMITASAKMNVIPATCELRVDCRVPPGVGREAVEAAIAEVLGDAEAQGFEIEFTEQVEGNSSPAHSPLMDAIRRWVAKHDRLGSVVPATMPGFTDSRHFRAAFPECVAYGFFPQRHRGLLESWPLIHGADERIDIRDLELATSCYVELIRALLSRT